MSSEKADLASDQVSLPPTYAPSEAFTESPPPAYKRASSTPVQIAKLICLTVFAITFLVGFFVVSHKWMQTRECNCPQAESLARQEALIAKAPSFIPLGDNELSESTNEPKDATFQVLEQTKEEETNVPEQELSVDSESDAETQDSLLNDNAPLKPDFQNKIKLPKDLLLGNSEQAGRDVQCNVEKRRQKIGEGIFTESIIVVCNDEDDNEEEVEEEKEETPVNHIGLKKILPPMSLLGDIMKALASRPRSNNPELVRDQMGPRPMPLPFPFMKRPLPGPVGGPFGPNMLRFVPLRRPDGPRHVPEMRELPQFPFPPHPPMGLHPVRIIKKITVNPGPQVEDQQQFQNSINPISIINSLPSPVAEQGSFPPPPPQVRIIKVPKQPMQQEDQPEEGPLPFMQPLLRLAPSRRARVLRIVPLNSDDVPQQIFNNFDNEEQNFDGPIPRGLLPFQPRPNEDEENYPEESVPEASGRSLPSPPVNFPGLTLVKLPGRPRFLPFPPTQVMTHMELRKAPENNEESESFPPQILQAQEQQQEGQDFGPPRTHTVIESAPEPIFRDDAPRQIYPEEGRSFPIQDQDNQQFEETPYQDEPISQPQFLPKFFVPPPPRFAPEGRSSPFAQINPDAELVAQPSEEQPLHFPQENHHVVLN